MSPDMRSTVLPPDELSASFSAIQAQLQLVFPATKFQFRVIPGTLTARVWSELTARTPAVLLGWEGFAPRKPASRRLIGSSSWAVFVVVRNQGGPTQRLVGDTAGPGLLDMVRAAAAVLHGHTATGIGTLFVTSVSQVSSTDWDMEELAVARVSFDIEGTELASASDLVPDSSAGILRQLDIGWDFAPDLLTTTDRIGAPRPARPRLGAIRWDAWYAPASALTEAVEADLTPAIYQARAPFFATATSDGTLSFNPSQWGTGAQSVMDTEIAYAVEAGLEFWAFLGHDLSAPESTALDLYLASSLRSELGFCLIEDATDLWSNGAPTVSFADVVAKVQQAGYVTVLDGRPLIFILDAGDLATTASFGGTAGLGAAMAELRRAVQAGCGRLPYLVIQCPETDRAAELLLDAGFDALSAYAVPPWPVGTESYASLRGALQSWWHIAADHHLPIVPPLMAGWDPSPRVTTPNALFGSESTPPQALVTNVTADEIAEHVREGLAWVRAHPDVAETGIALLYAWNEHDEGGWIAPTYLAGTPLGDPSRVTALAALKGNS